MNTYSTHTRAEDLTIESVVYKSHETLVFTFGEYPNETEVRFMMNREETEPIGSQLSELMGKIERHKTELSTTIRSNILKKKERTDD